MRKTLTSNELETMISKCVGQVLAESRQKQTPRRAQKRVLTESQLQSYIQNVINEEMEKEGFGNYMKGALGYVGGKVKDKVKGFGQNVKDTLGNINQAGNNASFIADTQKLAQNIQMFKNNYGDKMTEEMNEFFIGVINEMNKMVTQCKNGEFQA